MLMTVEELKQFITTDKSEPVLEAMLQALEWAIRGYTNNNFQDRNYRRKADIIAGDLYNIEAVNPFDAGDTVQISESKLNNGLYTVVNAEDTHMKLNDMLKDEKRVLLTKVVYPMNVKLGVARLIQWELDNGNKVGIQSESISRHSVTYFNLDGSNSVMGYPQSLMGFLQPYRKARF